jgi:flagellar hook-basal body complex protein FliE
VSPLPIDPSIAVSATEASIPGVGSATRPDAVTGATSGGDGGSFGSLLAEQVSNLERLQADGAEASRALATGTAQDLPSVVAAVERARLSMELASQVRTRAVEAYQEIFRTQV